MTPLVVRWGWEEEAGGPSVRDMSRELELELVLPVGSDRAEEGGGSASAAGEVMEEVEVFVRVDRESAALVVTFVIVWDPDDDKSLPRSSLSLLDK